MAEGLRHQATKVTRVIPGRCAASNPESRDSGSGANAPSRNDEPRMDCFVTTILAAMTSLAKPRLPVLAARRAQVMHKPLASESEGAGKTGCRPHPQPRVQLNKHTS